MDDAAPLAQLYPDYDFATLPRRAWAAGIVLDYLETLPQVDMKRVAIWGGSRDGKMATIAAAMDERFAALLAVTTGVGGVLPWRLSGERGYGEGIETLTRRFPTWFVPRLRFFAGREDRLPVNGNLLTAMIAPRACLMEYGLNDEVTNSWGERAGVLLRYQGVPAAGPAQTAGHTPLARAFTAPTTRRRASIGWTFSSAARLAPGSTTFFSLGTLTSGA